MNSKHPDPRINDWYRSTEDEMFRVVALNDGDHTIEVQMQDGDIQELDDEDWPELVMESMEEPDDWSVGFDNLEPDEIEEADSAMRPIRHRNPLDDLYF